MRSERYVFEYFCNRPAVVFWPVVEHLRRLLEPRVDFCKRIGDCTADFLDCFCIWHPLDSSQLVRSVPGKRPYRRSCQEPTPSDYSAKSRFTGLSGVFAFLEP